MIIETISNLINNNPPIEPKNIKILEFGSGSGFQIPSLRKIGSLVVSDIYISNDIKKMKDIDSYECGISNTPFDDCQFDIIFSNHVVEHIEDKYDAFKEMKRIGGPDCIYAFSVPTNIWLLLGVPATHYNIIRKIGKRLLPIKIISSSALAASECKRELKKENNISKKLVRYFLPAGHGACSDFIECYKSFKIKSWNQLFSDNGFSIIKIQPLLLYGPSEWPIIPTMTIFNRSNICSSVLFLMRKRT